MVSIEPGNWTELLSQYERMDSGIVYKLFDIETMVDIRYAIIYPLKTRAILIQLEDCLETHDIIEPNWRGLEIDEIILDTPKPGTRHMILKLTHEELLDIFSRLTSDIIEEIMKAHDRNQAYENLRNCLNLWNYFFRKCGPEGMSKERQRGLMGELLFLKKILESGKYPSRLVNSWKGCERDYHDFQISERAIEIKTTMGKEPLKVIINSERQLDDTGLSSLYIGITHLSPSYSGGFSLNHIIEEIRKVLQGTGQALIDFEERLFMAGYLQTHEKHYHDRYEILENFYYEVTDGFPRIISLPQGIGDLKYSITISSCSDYIKDETEVLEEWVSVILNG